MNYIAFDMTEAMFGLLIVNVVTILSLLGKGIYDAFKTYMDAESAKEKRRQDRLDREQDRLDIAAIAALTASQLEAMQDRLRMVDDNGKNRLKVLLQSNITTRQYAKNAIDTANNTNQKIAKYGQDLMDARSSPREVVVMNADDDPVPTVNHDQP